MRRLFIFLIFLLVLLPGIVLKGAITGNFGSPVYYIGDKDTLERQILYNGRAWRNFYTKVKGDQFFLTSDFSPGTVTINNKLFRNLLVRYDILNDEVLIIASQGIVLQLNKEMVDGFTINFISGSYGFQNLEKLSLDGIRGYANVLYNGNISLFVKYRKEILKLVEENKFDVFQQIHRIYILKEGKMYSIANKKDILRLFENNKQEIRNFIKSNKIKVSKKRPESFKTVVEFCDNLRH
jgi:hypothetical protein